MARALLITGVGFDVDDVPPRAVWAMTVTRNVCPTSRRVSTYLSPRPRRAIPIGLQARPFVLQRRHW